MTLAKINKTAKQMLKQGQVIYQGEETLLDTEREKKDLTLSELNHVFKRYLSKREIKLKGISILGQFSIIYNDPRFAIWHELSKQEQSDALGSLVVMPEVYDDLIAKIGAIAGDEQIIRSIVKDAYQNALDSFSHAAYIQQKYVDHFPGIKIILFLDQRNEAMILAVVDNGFGKKVNKPKKSFTGQEYGNDFLTRIVDWLVRRFVEKEAGEVEWDIAYTGGQGMALKKLQIELQMDVDLHFFVTGAVFELKLKSFF